jgi:hypothetical protein
LFADLGDHIAIQDVEAFFEGMQVRLNDTPCLQVADAGAHVDRTHATVHIGRAPKAGALVFVEFRRLCFHFVYF